MKSFGPVPGQAVLYNTQPLATAFTSTLAQNFKKLSYVALLIFLHSLHFTAYN